MRRLLMLACLALHAPAPLPREAPPPAPDAPVCGTWRLLWDGTYGRATLHPGGGWEAKWGGSDWQGAWVLTGQHLTITERTTTGGTIYTWTVELTAGPREGSLVRGGRGAFVLDLPPPEE